LQKAGDPESPDRDDKISVKHIQRTRELGTGIEHLCD
jgi:hypothetical protein